MYYLMGSPDERVEEKDGFTLIWKRTELLRISERVSVRFRDRRVVSWNIAE
ncbi:MAG: hypothetical protein Q3977_02015 [Oscillospiraceae bacterium]|nr:hypothetical protein [Oscillospiraceae bacterium]